MKAAHYNAGMKCLFLGPGGALCVLFDGDSVGADSGFHRGLGLPDCVDSAVDLRNP